MENCRGRKKGVCGRNDGTVGGDKGTKGGRRGFGHDNTAMGTDWKGDEMMYKREMMKKRTREINRQKTDGESRG